MRSFPSGWNTVLAKLGLRRRRRRLQSRNLSRRTRFEAMEPRQMLSITVSTLADDNNGATNGTSLREALAIAAANSGPDEIVFSPGLAGTIELGGTALSITSDVEIIGPGSDLLTIDANGASQVIAVNNGSATLDVTLRGLTITGGT
jgi:hypothetical protein